MLTKKYCLIGLAFLSGIFSVQTSAEEGQQVTLKYDFMLGEKNAGSVHTRLSWASVNGEMITQINTETKIRYRVAFVTLFSLDSNEQVWLNEKEVVKYAGKMNVDGVEHEIAGQLKGDGFHLEWTEDGNKQTQAIDRDAYQFTSYDTPGELFQKQKARFKYRILDLESMAVIEETVVWVRNETITIDDSQIPCHVVQFKNQGAAGTRWISPDFHYLIVKEEGKDAEGTYAIVLAQVIEK